jgi:hypothetical protein
MRIFVLLLSLAMLPSLLHAQAWYDFEMDLGDGFKLVRANPVDVAIYDALGISKKQISPWEFEGIGPVVAYAITDKFIFSQNAGAVTAKDAQHAAGYRIESVDTSQRFYFAFDKLSRSLIGPMSQVEFIEAYEAKAGKQIPWTPVRNPNILLPLVGTLAFLYFWAMYHPLRALVVVIIAISLIVILLRLGKWLYGRGYKTPT